MGMTKDMVIRGGINLFPREIEEFLIRHPDVADVHVIGVPDVYFGEELLAVVIPKAGAQLTEQTLRQYCKARSAIRRFRATSSSSRAIPRQLAAKCRSLFYASKRSRPWASRT